MSAARRIADVITLPRAVGSQTAAIASSAGGRVRARTANEVDDWGRDGGFVDRFRAASHVRWNTSVGGAEHLPERAGALVVVNARRFALTPMFAALAIGAAVDRPVRFVGRPDAAPLGPLMQRLGALLAIESEVEGALRSGELVVLGARHEMGNDRSGIVDHRLVGAAVAAKVRVLPAAAISVPTRRSARVEIGPPVRLARTRRGPLTELELADRLKVRIDELLDELGGTTTGTPLDRRPPDGVGDS